MKRAVIGFMLLLCLYMGCVPEEGGERTKENLAKGGRIYGGTFYINERDELQTLFPYSIIDAVSQRIAIQIYEGLVKLNMRNLNIMPNLAESWEISPDGKVYTFHLKKGVRFHDDPCFSDGKGREVTAKDFKYSFELLCSPLINDSVPNVLFERTLMNKVKGANQFYEAAQKGNPGNLEGVKVIDDHTLQITLEQPSPTFLYILAYPAASALAKEAVDKYGEMLTVGTGPFMFYDWFEEKDEITGEPIDRLVLIRNNNYHRFDTLGNQLPFLDTLSITFYNSQKRELALFQEERLDMILGLPAESIRDIVEQKIAFFEQKPPRFILERIADMTTQFYEFNLTRPVFSDKTNGKKVRHAFNYAIDRRKIVDKVLRGEAYGPGINGITPPSFKDYDITRITGYDFDPEKARKLLAEAGYPKGEKFPTIKLELNSGGYKHTSVAFEIQKQLKEVLNINVELDIVPMSKLLEDRRYGKSDLFRIAWAADYPSPENFLMQLYGKTVPATPEEPSFYNAPRYVNPAFDELYEKGITADSLKAGYESLIQAEQLMMNDAPIIVLWYEEQYQIIQSNVQNFFNNSMHYRDFSEVYKKEPVTAIKPTGQNARPQQEAVEEKTTTGGEEETE